MAQLCKHRCLNPVAAWRILATLLLVLCIHDTAQAQEIEPRSYSNAPIGVNFLVIGFTETEGSLSTDPALPITDPELKTSSAIAAYARVVDLWGRSGKVDVIVPYTWLDGTAQQEGQTLERNVDGWSDPRLRVSINLYGAPALSLKEFANYRQDLIIGASLQVTAPAGQYDEDRLVNIGSNRWALKPELGASKRWGPWTLELMAAATLYSDNDEFYNGNRREQAPVYSGQGHLIYSFESGIWASLSATYFTGGQTTLNGVDKDDELQNWRFGGTLAFPVNKRHSVKLYASEGVAARTGNDFNLFGLAWQYRWGGGL